MKQEISKFPSFNHSGKEHIINTFTSKECDKPAENKDVTSNLFMEAKLKNVSRKCFETEANGFKVILDFPKQNNCEMEETQLKEVKQIMLDVYTVKDGLLTPDLEDVMGMLKLAMQYGMAEKTV